MVHIQFIVHTHYLWTMAEEDLFFIQCPPIFKIGASQLTNNLQVILLSCSIQIPTHELKELDLNFKMLPTLWSMLLPVKALLSI